MVGLDVGQFAPQIARLLLLRGGGLPPLLWCNEPHQGAQKILDELSEPLLFAPVDLARADMAAAVRAMLYLWHGWAAECLKCSRAVPEPQRFYLAALCARQARRGDESQAALKQLGDHPISAPLMTYALSILPPAVDAPLQRLRDTLQAEHCWQPILFADAWTAGAGGQLRPTGETILRQIQCREFELLLSWLYEQATGQKLGHRRTAESDDASVLRARQRERRLKEMRRRREEAVRRHQANTTGARAKAKDHGDDSRSTSPAAPDARPPAGLRIRCPKCNGVLTVPLASRGKAARCGQCRAGFIVPSGGESSENVIGIICPQCSKRLTFTSAARGKKAQCMHCAVVFVVPPAPASATPKS